MVLTFKKRDFTVIEEVAKKIDMNISNLLKEAGEAVHYYTDIYENPRTISEYSNLVNVNFEISEREYRKIADRADRYGVTIEMILLESVRFIDLLKSQKEVKVKGE